MVSVIIPSYNRGEVIERSVRSVLNQTYRDIEVIVVDDGSSDNTKEVLDNMNDKRIRYIRHKANQGACASRNTGIAAAKGEYIAFQDSDDIWKPEKLKVQLDALRLANADVCFCRMRKYDIDSSSSVLTVINLKEGIVPYKTLYQKPKVSTQTILAKRNVFMEFQFDEKVKKAQDYDWTIRAGEKYSFYFVAQALVDQYLQKNSISIVNRIHQVETHEYFYEKFKNKYDTNKDLQIVLLKRLAYFRTVHGINASEDYKKIYILTHKKKDYFLYIASNIKILKVHFYCKKKIKQFVKYFLSKI